MDAFGFRLLGLLILLPRAPSAGDTTEVVGAVGGSVTFHSHNPDGKPAFWDFGSVPIGTVLFEDPPRAVFSEARFQRRFSISEDGNALTLSHLTMEDAGSYSVKTEGKTSTFTLRVYRALAEPTVTCEAQNCSAGSCRFSLRCSALGTDLGNVSFFWSRGERLWDEGPTVLVGNESSWNELEPLTCTARNPVSSRNVTVVALGDLCAGVSHEEGPHPGSLGRVVAVAVAEAAALSSIFLLFHCRGQREARLSSSGR